MDNKKLGETLNDKRIGEQDLRTFVDPKKVLEAKKPKPKRTKKNSEDFYQDYSNSTDNEKILLKKELEKQLARVDYLSYLNYVHSSIFKPTRFHKFLAAVCEKVVMKIEAGEDLEVLSYDIETDKFIPNKILKAWQNRTIQMLCFSGV